MGQAQSKDSTITRLIASVTAWALQRRAVRAGLMYSGRRGPMFADSITYRALFSIFAALLLGLSIAALWLGGNPVAWKALLDAIDQAVPGLTGFVNTDDLIRPVGFSIAGAISLIGLIGAALSAIGSLRTALRVLAGTTSKDAFFLWVTLRNLALAAGIGLSVVASAGLTFAARLGIAEVSAWLGLDGGAARWGIRIVSLIIVLAINVTLVGAAFRTLSGLRVSFRSLLTGSLIGGLGLLILQEFSSLFVGGATSNPLLGIFASLIALLLWVNLSVQVILYASCYIIMGAEEEHNRVSARFGAPTLPDWKVRQAEKAVAEATAELRAAREAAQD